MHVIEQNVGAIIVNDSQTNAFRKGFNLLLLY